MRRIAIVCTGENDLAALLLQNCPGACLFDAAQTDISLDEFDALCLLGGNLEKPWIVPAALRLCVEQMREQGKPVFAEFVASLGRCIVTIRFQAPIIV